MDTQATRFFCTCGRLLTAQAGETLIACPTCRKRSAVPGGAPPAPAPVASSSSSTTAVLAPRDGARLGHYRLGRPIGRGGMGAVHEAVDERTGERVALKILHATLQNHEAFVSRFQREARAAAALAHPNIVRVLDHGVEGGVPWLAMELLEGEDLLQYSRHGQRLPEAQVRSWMLQAAAGLRAAARQGITHRDIKPTNLVLVGDVLKIADFGLAKAADSDSHLTLTGEVLGTPHYMSPEQGRGGGVDQRSDLYSFGACFYHLLAGRPVFTADSPVAVIMKHLHEEPPALRQHAPHVSPGMEQVIHRLLQKNPADRYPDYDALIADLEALARGQAPSRGAAPPVARVQQGNTTYFLPEQRTRLLLRPAGGLRRMLALFVDLVALELMLTLVVWIATGFRTGHPWFDRARWTEAGQESPFLLLLNLLLAFAFLVASDAAGGRSIGKRWLRLRVCRLDGRDLGGARGLVRALLVLPGFLMSPVLATTTAGLTRVVDAVPDQAPRSIQFAGLAWFVVAWLLGRFAGSGRPLQDLAVGAEVYRAQPLETVRMPRPSGRSPSPRAAFVLSLLPGVGLMYAGRMWTGLGFMVLIPAALSASQGESRLPYLFWLISAIWAHSAARRRRTAALAGAPDPLADPTVVHRQES